MKGQNLGDRKTITVYVRGAQLSTSHPLYMKLEAAPPLSLHFLGQYDNEKIRNFRSSRNEGREKNIIVLCGLLSHIIS